MRRYSAPLAQALNLPRTRLFRALALITLLLAFTVALLAAGAGLLQNLYGHWQLQRQDSILLYFPPETLATVLEPLSTTLPTLAGVASVRQVPLAELQATLAPLLGEGEAMLQAGALPLPVVAEVRLQRGAPRPELLAFLAKTFPTAELDDQQTLLGRVAESVRWLQAVAAAVAALLGGVLVLFMALTIRAGLLAQEGVVRLLIQLGAADTALARTITLQTLWPVLAGTGLGVTAAAIVLLVLRFTPTLAPHLSLYLSPAVWLVLLFAPLALPLVAALAAWAVSLKLLKAN